MTLRFTTSFDNLQDSDRDAVFSSAGATGTSAQLNFNTAYSRWPTGKGMRFFGSIGPLNSFNVFAHLQFDLQSAWYFGIALRPPTYPFGNTIYEICTLQDGGSNVFELRMGPAGVLYVTRNGTVVDTGSAQLPTGQFSFVEFGVVIHPTAGSYTVRVNGANYLSASGVNTTGTGNPRANLIRMGFSGSVGTSGSAGGELWFDDWYIADGTGSGVNGLLGDCRPIELLPNANGSFSDWTQTGGTGGSPYTAVNDTPNNGDTSYLASGTLNARTTLRYPTIPAGVLKAVVLSPFIRKDDANSHRIAARTYESATESTSAQQVQPATSYGMQQIVMETDPLDGAAWTTTKINNTEFGIVLAT